MTNPTLSVQTDPSDCEAPGKLIATKDKSFNLSTRHLLSIDDLSDSDIRAIIERALAYTAFIQARKPAPQTLLARTQVNLFFEDSTRTNLSFDLAGKKLGANVINVPVAASSVNKNEELIDTVQTLDAMCTDVMIVRANEPGIHKLLVDRVQCSVINAGDGTHEHPTQALLDAVTMIATLGGLSGKTIAICGDIKHSRVASSGVRLFQRLGARVRFVGPALLMPDSGMFDDVDRFENLQAGLSDCDIVMTLRMQFERMSNARTIKADTFFNEFGLTHETLKYAKPDAWVMHPGPINRGIELSGALADDPKRSLILQQVFHGVATRMAVLDLIVNRSQPVERKTSGAVS